LHLVVIVLRFQWGGWRLKADANLLFELPRGGEQVMGMGDASGKCVANMLSLFHRLKRQAGSFGFSSW